MKEDDESQPLNGKKVVRPSEEGESNSLKSNDQESLIFKRAQTAVLGFGLFAVGSSYGTFNTALPDLVDLYDTTTANLSLLFTVTAAGRVSAGMLMGVGWVSLHNPFKWFFFSLLLMSIMLAMVPFVGHWQVLIFVNFVLGQANGLIFAGSTAYCLQLWRKGNSEPYMHYLHFIQACGFLFSPALGTLVLPNGKGDTGLQIAPGINGVKSYFVLMALIYQIITPMYLYFAIKHSGKSNADEENGVAKTKEKGNFLFWILISVFGFMFFLGVMPWSMGMLMTTFAASPSTGIEMTRAQGARLYLIFFAFVTAARLIAILASTKMKASKTVYVSLIAMLLPCAAIVYRQSSMSPLELDIYVAVMGTGLGPLYSQTMMSLEEMTPVRKRAAGILYVYHTLGFLVIPWGLGQVADEHPYLLFALCAVAAGLLIVGFAILLFLKNLICKLLSK